MCVCVCVYGGGREGVRKERWREKCQYGNNIGILGLCPGFHLSEVQFQSRAYMEIGESVLITTGFYQN